MALVLAFAGGAQAQPQEDAGAAKALDAEPGLEELLRQPLKQVPRDVEVSTASRFAQSATQAPSTTYVVTAGDIARFGYRNMSDILCAMPGLYVTKGIGFSYVARVVWGDRAISIRACCFSSMACASMKTFTTPRSSAKNFFSMPT